MGRTWGRLYSGTRNHRKIKILAQRHPVLWMAWYVLLEMSFEIDDDGWIYVSPDIPYSFKELAKELRIRREDHLKNLCTTLEELGMIAVSDRGIQILSYSERNFETDSSTPRVQKYRERQKEETLPKRFCNGDETETRNAPRTDTETETEQNRKKIRAPSRPPGPCQNLLDRKNLCRLTTACPPSRLGAAMACVRAVITGLMISRNFIRTIPKKLLASALKSVGGPRSSRDVYRRLAPCCQLWKSTRIPGSGGKILSPIRPPG